MLFYLLHSSLYEKQRVVQTCYAFQNMFLTLPFDLALASDHQEAPTHLCQQHASPDTLLSYQIRKAFSVADKEWTTLVIALLKRL